jgi:hypothetical protein
VRQKQVHHLRRSLVRARGQLTGDHPRAPPVQLSAGHGLDQLWGDGDLVHRIIDPGLGRGRRDPHSGGDHRAGIQGLVPQAAVLEHPLPVLVQVLIMGGDVRDRPRLERGDGVGQPLCHLDQVQQVLTRPRPQVGRGPRFGQVAHGLRDLLEKLRSDHASLYRTCVRYARVVHNESGCPATKYGENLASDAEVYTGLSLVGEGNHARLPCDRPGNAVAQPGLTPLVMASLNPTTSQR